MKKGIRIFSIIISVLILLFILLIGSFNYVMSGTITGNTNCNNEFLDAFLRAYNSQDPSYCLEYSGPLSQYKNFKGYYSCTIPKTGLMEGAFGVTLGDHKENCVKILGEALGDADICESISDPNLRNSCITGVAIVNKDGSICDELKDYEGNPLNDSYGLVEYRSCKSLSGY